MSFTRCKLHLISLNSSAILTSLSKEASCTKATGGLRLRTQASAMPLCPCCHCSDEERKPRVLIHYPGQTGKSGNETPLVARLVMGNDRPFRFCLQNQDEQQQPFSQRHSQAKTQEQDWKQEEETASFRKQRKCASWGRLKNAGWK